MSYDGFPPPPPPPPTHGYNMPTGGGSAEHPDGTKLLIMGILSVVCCTLLGPFTWMMANKAQEEIRSGAYAETSMVKAGQILGMIGTAFLALGVLWFILSLSLGLMA